LKELALVGDKPYHQVAYYISSFLRSAVDFAHGIRGHWGIENSLPQR
jgi:predicted transposase YbfD/YdcC